MSTSSSCFEFDTKNKALRHEKSDLKNFEIPRPGKAIFEV